jgi:hypothetical protein
LHIFVITLDLAAVQRAIELFETNGNRWQKQNEL